ncbi:hypothetical protein AVEN_187918-1 [Araneus ventricosus]|uniref:Uncharacterized protein n=1 Tax=Araneus ventricosus TaxID=182803 RepID=A0A4Y2I9Z1_ARAVE|nr:hypothetical protein AVEN_232295-1 [Araneus ventricosus]GBM74312.1 hypothetical protein AVEN_125999-1 [Araneus ventricosus]GBM74320.1 hypothetical protein AVEN_136676-1 [Araneus ventricosus]GBM74346.1 hypothetical protein AVEN_187918-1 [Araneus ventricosus]
MRIGLLEEKSIKWAMHLRSKLEFLVQGKEKTYRQGRNHMKFGTNGFEVVEFKRTQNPKRHPPIPIWDLDARLAGKPRLGPRVEVRNETRNIHLGEEEFAWQEF